MVADPVRGCSPLQPFQQGACPLPRAPFDSFRASVMAQPFCSDGGGGEVLQQLPPVLLMQRGECSFVIKVQRGADAGAAAVFIGNAAGHKDEVVEVPPPPLPRGRQLGEHTTVSSCCCKLLLQISLSILSGLSCGVFGLAICDRPLD